MIMRIALYGMNPSQSLLPMEVHMFKVLLASLLLTLSIAHAKVDAAKTPMREVKAWMKSVDRKTTCVDEYYKRRYHLGIRMGFTPAIIAGSAAAGVFAGGFIGYQAFMLSGAAVQGFADLAAMAAGGFIGGITGITGSGVDTGFAVVDFFRNQNLLRLIYESRHEGGAAVDGYFADYQSKFRESNISKEEFESKVSTLDESGKLCDGSIVDPRRYKKGRRLKQRIANKKELFKFISGVSSADESEAP